MTHWFGVRIDGVEGDNDMLTNWWDRARYLGLMLVMLLLAETGMAQKSQERACLANVNGEVCSKWVAGDTYPTLFASHRVKPHNWIRRHPVITGMLIGGGVGLTTGLLTRQGSCSYAYEGEPGSGTTCPKVRPKGGPVWSPGAH